jgi:hypothetical protein
MNIYITIEINETDTVFDKLEGFKKLSIDIAFNKYNYDVLKDKPEKRLEYIALEISLQDEDILLGNSCYNLSDILFLNNELSKYNLVINSIIIPSTERLKIRKKDAIEKANMHGRWVDTDENEIERSFIIFENTLNEIKNYFLNTTIRIICC